MTDIPPTTERPNIPVPDALLPEQDQHRLDRITDPAQARDTVTDEAVVFVYALDSRYFAEVFTVLGNELQATDPDQAIALDKLHTRLLAMRDLLEKRLRDLAAPEAAESRVIE